MGGHGLHPEVSHGLSLDAVQRPTSRGGWKWGGSPRVSVWRFSSGAAGICPPPPPIRTKVSCSIPLAGVGLRWDSQRLFLSPDISGPADPIAPAIIIPPKNTSVVAGSSEVTMECVANARWVLPPPPPPTLAPVGTSDLRAPRRPGGIHKGPEMSREDPRKKMGYLAWRRVGGQRAVGRKQSPLERSGSWPRTSGVGGGSTHF